MDTTNGIKDDDGNMLVETDDNAAQWFEQILLWNKDIPSVVENCVTELIAVWVKAEPNTEAVCSWDGSFTYAELDDLSSRLAYHLVENGIIHEVIVPVCFEKSKWAIVSLLAVLKAGGAFVLLDPSIPAARLSSAVEQTKAQLALASRAQLDLISPLVDKVFIVDDMNLSPLSATLETSAYRVSPSCLAYVIFTSGSTGEPKGVMVEHSQLATSAIHHGKGEGFPSRPRFIQFASFAFDACIRDIVTTLVHGGTVCIPSEWERKNDLVKAMNRMKVTCGSFTPSFIGSLEPGSVETMDTVLLGGESTPLIVWNTWAPVVRLILSYGPTETTITSAVLDTSLVKTSTPGAIGRAVGCRNWIVRSDNFNELAREGETGELLIEGPIVARGYLGDPKKTMDRFITDPEWMRDFRGNGCRPGSRFYRTGDLVQSYRFSNESQGQRLELGEVESKLQQCLSEIGDIPTTHVLVDAVILVDRPDSKVLVAMLCPDHSKLGASLGYLDWDREDGARVITSPEECQSLASFIINIEQRLSTHLPDYALPSLYIPLQTVPFAVSGKVDRRRLSSAVAGLATKQLDRFATSQEDIDPPSCNPLPLNVTEEILQTIWARVLNIEPHTITAEGIFFRLGGDSVQAIRLVSEARRAGLDLTFESVFRHPILRKMAESALPSLRNGAEDQELQPFALLSDMQQDIQLEASRQCGVPKDAIEEIYPCTPMQSGLWYASLRHPGSYIMQVVYSLPLSLDVANFQHAWSATTLQHAILRTTFIEHTSGLLQVVLKDQGEIRIEEHRVLNEVLLQDQSIGLDYGQPLSRATLVRQSDPPKLDLAWTVHHALMDGWSLPIIENTVEKLHDEPSSATMRGPGFNGFIQYVLRQSREKGSSFWSRNLIDSSATPFPPDLLSKNASIATHTMEHDFPGIQAGGFTAATIVQAAWSLLIGVHTNRTDVCAGMVLNGRTAPIQDIENIAGPTLATVPFRVQFTKDQPLTSMLEAIQQHSIELIEFQHIGLRNLSLQVGKEAVSWDFDTILGIQSAVSKKVGRLFGHRKLSYFNVDRALLLECYIGPDGCKFHATYNKNALPKNRMRQLLDQFAHLIHNVCAAAIVPYSKVSDVELISPTDLKQIMTWNNNGIIPKATEMCIHTLFEQRVKMQPTAPAVCAWDGNLTYEELDNYSGRLATHLVTIHGIGREYMVPICFEHSLWYFVSVLAILKAGGAWVPMDAKAPLARGKLIISTLGNDCAPLLLTSSHLESSVSPLGLPTLVVDSALVDELIKGDITASLPQVHPSDLCYVVFTSGSTGTPKGISIEHRSISTTLVDGWIATRLNTATRMLQFSNSVFDMSTLEALPTLVHGGCPVNFNQKTSLRSQLS
ncbi:acetyl-CoA synthetase-like protein [Tothia fuscella]|uniref:Acetyl-CoA synthetase-like protein n=1 Tax=Tothia fuscella TaxID=1048955 RepID=A0A9P4NHC4_9PEZI|nr:acetyl-CoA synthetase-like protein [Tothia fuscella]